MNFVGTFWSLVPPIIAIALALITKEVYMSLFIGILSAALLYANFSPIATTEAVRLWDTITKSTCLRLKLMC